MVAPTPSPASASRRAAKSPPTFRPFPAMLVFPNVPLLTFWLFNTGLTRCATSLLAHEARGAQPTCGMGCVLLAVVVLLMVGCVLAIGLVMLCHFRKHHCSASWVVAKVPTKAAEVHDPLLRFWSRVKTETCLRHILRPCQRPRPTERMQGMWAVLRGDQPDQVEPARTERLLAHPFRLLHLAPSDSQDAMQFHLLHRTNGLTLLGLAFSWVTMLIQVLLGVLYGLGTSLQRGGLDGHVQLATIAVIKMGWGVVLITCMPNDDRLASTFLSVQFNLEGVAVLLLLLANLLRHEELMERILALTFVMTLFPVFIPVLLKVYDLIVVNCVVHCCRRKFDWKEVRSKSSGRMFAKVASAVGDTPTVVVEPTAKSMLGGGSPPSGQG